MAIMQSQSKTFRETSLTLASLRKELQEITKLVHHHAFERASGDQATYVAHVTALLDELFERSDVQGRVICFAAGVAFGLSLRHQAERCREAAMHTGSDAVRILYWTAVRRMHGSRR